VVETRGGGEGPSKLFRETTTGTTPSPPKTCKNQNARNFSPRPPNQETSRAKRRQQPRCGLPRQINPHGTTTKKLASGNLREKSRKKKGGNQDEEKHSGRASFPCRSSTTWGNRSRHKNRGLMRWKPRSDSKSFALKTKSPEREKYMKEKAPENAKHVPGTATNRTFIPRRQIFSQVSNLKNTIW
jgi:hypothetical protein